MSVTRTRASPSQYPVVAETSEDVSVRAIAERSSCFSECRAYRMAVSIYRLETDYGASDFETALATYIVRSNNPSATAGAVRELSSTLCLGFQKLPVYHKAKFWEDDFPRYRHASDKYDVIHVTPARQNKRKDVIPGRFDTVLVNVGTGGAVGVTGYRIAQVRAIFSIPKRRLRTLFPNHEPPQHLAYIEWFSPFGARPEPNHGMYKVTRSMRNGKRETAVIPLTDIRRSVHLHPAFGPIVPRDWSSSNVLDKCPKFFVSNFMDRHAYGTIM
ncbi:hypothetical protein PsYK624_143780 [Phanerochaete sordida]|uniref:Uncharacterized protein n=1 Tax=Phanerochaete sordida TaxID=48140 RepID=A0A9P3LK48_9APHY|nr:hypothetical protein PsYK624_143780 [Phanerochaete sordida]